MFLFFVYQHTLLTEKNLLIDITQGWSWTSSLLFRQKAWISGVVYIQIQTHRESEEVDCPTVWLFALKHCYKVVNVLFLKKACIFLPLKLPESLKQISVLPSFSLIALLCRLCKGVRNKSRWSVKQLQRLHCLRQALWVLSPPSYTQLLFTCNGCSDCYVNAGFFILWKTNSNNKSTGYFLCLVGLWSNKKLYICFSWLDSLLC